MALLLAGLLSLLSGCASTQEVRKEWARNVASEEYGWIDFNTGEVKNLDPYPPSRIDYLQSNLYPDYSQQCLEQLRTYTSEVVLEVHFLLTEKGNPGRFIIVSDRASACAHNVIDALRRISFRPGLWEGQPLPSVGEYRRGLSPGGGYRNR